MYFLIHSVKTHKWLHSFGGSGDWRLSEKNAWIENQEVAIKFSNPGEAFDALNKMPKSTKAHIVLFDGKHHWNITKSIRL